MKAKIIIIVLLAITFCRLTAQNIEPAQQPVNYCGNPNYVIQSTSPEFTQDTVFNGWMWGSKHVISKALGCTQSDNWYNDSLYTVPDYSNMFVRSNPWQALYCDHGHGANVLFGRAMVFFNRFTAIRTKCKISIFNGNFFFRF